MQNCFKKRIHSLSLGAKTMSDQTTQKPETQKETDGGTGTGQGGGGGKGGDTYRVGEE